MPERVITDNSEAGNNRVSGDAESRRATASRRRKTLSPPTWVKLSVPLLILTILALGAGGRFPSILIIAAVLAVLGLWTNPPTLRKATHVHWYAGLTIMLWLAFTTLPLPQQFLGEKRVQLHNRAAMFIDTLAEVYPHPEIMAMPQATQGQNKSENKSSTSSASGKNLYRLTLNYSGTIRFMMLFCGAWAMMWIASALTGRQRHTFLVLVVAGGTLMAVLSLVGLYIFPPGNRVWWLFPVNRKIGAGPFVNINHFASFCALLTPAAMSLLISPFPARNGSHQGHAERHPPAEKASRQRRATERRKSSLQMVFRRFFFGLCLILLMTATISSFSRGGMLMMLVACCTAAIVWIRSSPVAATLGTILAAGVLFAFIFWPSQKVQREIDTLQGLVNASPKRTQMRTEAIRQWQAFPLFGSGAESFRTLNGVYRIKPSDRSPLYVENEYAQLLAEHGWWGLALGLFFGGSLVWLIGSHVYHNARLRRKFQVLMSPVSEPHDTLEHRIAPRLPQSDRAVMAAGIGAAVGILFHSTCDFPLRVPLNAFLGAALIGLTLPIPLQPSKIRGRLWRWRRITLTLFILIAVGFWHGDRLRLDDPAFLQNADIPDLATALDYAPGYWAIWNEMHQRTTTRAYTEAQSQASSRDEPGNKANPDGVSEIDFEPMELYLYGIDCLEKAAQLNQADYRMWVALAQQRQRLGFAETEPGKVREPLRKGVELAPQRPQLWKRWFDFEQNHGNRKQLLHVAEKAREIATGNTAFILWRRIYQSSLKNDRLADALNAARNITEMQPDSADWWRRRADLEEQQDAPGAAVESLQKATDAAPRHWQTWVKLGKLQLQQGDAEAANKAFTQATRIHPPVTDKVDQLWREYHLR